MRITDISKPVSANSLNESLAKKFGQRIALEKFTLEQLEDARNKIRTKLAQIETNESFDAVNSEPYQKSKSMLDVLNAAIKERTKVKNESKQVNEETTYIVLFKGQKVNKKYPRGVKVNASSPGEAQNQARAKVKKEFGHAPDIESVGKAQSKNESKQVNEKAKSKDQQQAAAIALKHKKEGTKPKPGTASAEMMSMSKSDLEDYAETKHKGLPKDKKNESRRSVKESEFRVKGTYTKDGDDKPVSIKVSASSEAEAKKKASSQLSKNHKNYRATKVEKMSEAVAENEGSKGKYGVFKKGGTTGEQKGLVKSFDSKDEAVEYAKRMRKQLSTGERKYYGLNYTVKPLSNESRRSVKEGAADTAELIMAAKDMVDKLTGWMEDTAEMQTESMLDLADAIRDELGSEQSEEFVSNVKPSLESLYAAMETTRTELNRGVALLSGEEEPADMMGADDEMDDEMGDADVDTDDEVDVASNDDVEVDIGDDEDENEFGSAEAATGGEEEAGREKRESVQRSRNLGKILASSKKK